jgi:hypothetical protein
VSSAYVLNSHTGKKTHLPLRLFTGGGFIGFLRLIVIKSFKKPVIS